MAQHMQFDEGPERGEYQASSPLPRSQEEPSTSDHPFERTSAETLKPPSQYYPRPVRLLGLLLLVLALLLTIGLALGMGISFTFLLMMIAVDVDVLFFLGFWLLFRKRKIPAPHD